MPDSFFADLITSIAQRGRALFPKQLQRRAIGYKPNIADLCSALLSRRGEASGVALAAEVLGLWDELDPQRKKEFLVQLARDFGPSIARLDEAVAKWNSKKDEAAARNLHAAAEPRRQELIRRLNLAPAGTRRLVSMREEVFLHRKELPELDALDLDFLHLFSSWFNRGFLVLKRIDWSTSASILEKIIRYEAVHAIDDWTELRRRIEPDDRRLFAFFHPQMLDEPLIFVEVALTDKIPDGIQPLLDPQRPICRANSASTAVFYSISNCQDGLKGVSFGSFLIKQVVEDLKRELPNLNTFVTLSPVPGFRQWLDKQRQAGQLAAEELDAFIELHTAFSAAHVKSHQAITQIILRHAAEYFLVAKDRRGRPLDPVARFHLGNGARLEQLNAFGDRSPNGMKQSYGLMVNYLYDLENIELNHEAFAEKGEVIVSEAVRARLQRLSPAVL
jgi:malonyl-CoA decarboxylase